ncbi:MAG: hypothetical protein GWP05_07575 [Anaerolineaceae bacterium]|nr:hypothetical protein [Anaerolineaceae bacterium]
MKQSRVVVLLFVAVVVPVLAGGCGPAAVARKPWTDAPAKVRISAARLLALGKDPASAPSLVTALSDPDPTVRRLALYGLQRIGDAGNAKAIIPLLKDKEVWVQRTAAIALGKLRSKEVVPHLVKALKDKNLYVRLEALLALGHIGDPSSQKAIIEAMGNHRLWTELGVWDQLSVLHVIKRPFFTDREVIPILKNLLTYGQWKDPSFAKLEPYARKRLNLMIANRAADILAVKFGDASGEKFLVAGIEGLLYKGRRRVDDYMQQASAWAAARIKSTRAVPALVKMLDSEWINNKQYAIDAMGEIGDGAAVAPLEKMLKHEDVGLRRHAQAALRKIDGKTRQVDLNEPAAEIPVIAPKDLKTPGNKRPPMFICLGVDDCVNIEGLEAMLDVVETLKEQGRKVGFTMWAAPLSGDPKSRDMLKQKLLYQRLFDTGSEIAHHTLHHNPGGHNWRSLPRDKQIEEIEGCTQWFRDNIVGFTRPFTHKGGGGGRGAAIDPEFSRRLLRKQKFLYWGRRGGHPNDQMWPQANPKNGVYQVSTGELDGNAPPVHARITRPIRSDYPGQFDYEVADGVAMMMANFDYRYNHPRRPIFAVNAFHDWGLKSSDDSIGKPTHRNEAKILKEFLMEVLVRQKEKYPDTHVVTFRQVVEYVASGGDLKHTLAVGNCQDSRKAVKPVIK